MSFWHAWYDRPHPSTDRKTMWTPEPTPDYRALLKKYIEHVMDCEGVSFVHHGGSGRKLYGTLDETDITELHKIVEEINAE